jgi:acyl carrier protein
LCGNQVAIEPSLFFGDAPCPNCGTLLWFLRASSEMRFFEHAAADSLRSRVIRLVAEQLGITQADLVQDPTQLQSLDADSLDLVELVMQLEEEEGG